MPQLEILLIEGFGQRRAQALRHCVGLGVARGWVRFDAGDRPVGDQRQDGALGQHRHGHVEHGLDGVFDVQRTRQQLARLGKVVGAMDRFFRRRPRRFGPSQGFASRGLLLQLAVHAEQFDEHPHLRAQHLGHDRRGDVVDRAQGVAALGLAFVHVRRDEDDRRLGRFLVLADQAGRLQAVDVRHVHIEQDHREFLLQDVAQRLLARTRTDDVLAQLVQDASENDVLFREVVDHQDVDLLLLQGQRNARLCSAGHWCSHARRTASRSCVLTGFER